MAETQTPESTTAVVESPAAPDAPAVGLHEMSRSERDSFLSDGKIPTREAKEKPQTSDADADSSTAPVEGQKTAETAAKDRKAASEPAAPAKDKKARNSEENRINELLEDRRRDRERADRAERDRDSLMQRLDALENGKKDAPKDSSTAPDLTAKLKEIASSKDFPKIEDFENVNEWQAASHLFTQNALMAALTEKDTQTQAEVQRQQYIERVTGVAIDRLQADEQAHPELIPQVAQVLKDIVPMRLLPKTDAQGRPVKPLVQHYIKDQITFEVDHPLQLHAFYSTPEGKEELKAMAQMEAKDIDKTIWRRDETFRKSAQGQPADGKKPAAKTFTKAPPPPEKEGPKGAVAGDTVAAAVQTGDFEAFQHELDQREPETGRRWGRRKG